MAPTPLRQECLKMMDESAEYTEVVMSFDYRAEMTSLDASFASIIGDQMLRSIAYNILDCDAVYDRMRTGNTNNSGRATLLGVEAKSVDKIKETCVPKEQRAIACVIVHSSFILTFEKGDSSIEATEASIHYFIRQAMLRNDYLDFAPSLIEMKYVKRTSIPYTSNIVPEFHNLMPDAPPVQTEDTEEDYSMQIILGFLGAALVVAIIIASVFTVRRKGSSPIFEIDMDALEKIPEDKSVDLRQFFSPSHRTGLDKNNENVKKRQSRISKRGFGGLPEVVSLETFAIESKPMSKKAMVKKNAKSLKNPKPSKISLEKKEKREKVANKKNSSKVLHEQTAKNYEAQASENSDSTQEYSLSMDTRRSPEEMMSLYDKSDVNKSDVSELSVFLAPKNNKHSHDAESGVDELEVMPREPKYHLYKSNQRVFEDTESKRNRLAKTSKFQSRSSGSSSISSNSSKTDLSSRPRSKSGKSRKVVNKRDLELKAVSRSSSKSSISSNTDEIVEKIKVKQAQNNVLPAQKPLPRKDTGESGYFNVETVRLDTITEFIPSGEFSSASFVHSSSRSLQQHHQPNGERCICKDYKTNK